MTLRPQIKDQTTQDLRTQKHQPDPILYHLICHLNKTEAACAANQRALWRLDPPLSQRTGNEGKRRLCKDWKPSQQIPKHHRPSPSCWMLKLFSINQTIRQPGKIGSEVYHRTPSPSSLKQLSHTATQKHRWSQDRPLDHIQRTRSKDRRHPHYQPNTRRCRSWQGQSKSPSPPLLSKPRVSVSHCAIPLRTLENFFGMKGIKRHYCIVNNKRELSSNNPMQKFSRQMYRDQLRKKKGKEKIL